MKPRVLVACEFSGVVRDAFSAHGCDAWSCDLIPTEKPGNHFQGDVLSILKDGWDLMIAHPPCTFLSYAGIAHWNAPGRREKRDAAMGFFMNLHDAPIGRICIENPKGWPNTVFRKPTQNVQPYFFGEMEMKLTCLWLKNLPPLMHSKESNWFMPTHAARPIPKTYDYTGKARYFTDSITGKDRQKLRSVTFTGIARAMADQWAPLLHKIKKGMAA